MTERLTISTVAQRIGVRPSAIRFYERKGLIASGRLANGYRAYGPEAVDTLRFINRAKTLGFSLVEIREILEARRRGSRPCACVTTMIKRNLAVIDQRISALTSLRHQLLALAKRRPGRSGKDNICPIIEGD